MMFALREPACRIIAISILIIICFPISGLDDDPRIIEANGMLSLFSAGGVQITPGRGKEDWKWSFVLTGFGREDSIRPVSRVSPDSYDNRIEYDYGVISEWYTRRISGVEQGFTIDSRPAGCGPVVIEGQIDSDLEARLQSDGKSILYTRNGSLEFSYGDLKVMDAEGTLLASRLETGEGSLRIIIESGGTYPIIVDPLMSIPTWINEIDVIGAIYGIGVAAAGDVNGDTYPDFIVGASGEKTVYLYYGSSSGLSTTADWTVTGSAEAAGFGYAIAGAGDVNNDNYDDVLIGAYSYSGPESDGGIVYVYYGSASGLSATPDVTLRCTVTGARFGISLDSAGDINGDGYSDVVISASSYPIGGRAFLYLGSSTGLDTTAVWSYGDGGSSESVACAGDVNNDNYDDIIIGGPGLQKGQASIFFGSSTGIDTIPDWIETSDQTDSDFGEYVACAGDVNNDGYSDVIISAPEYDNGTRVGRVFVYLGSTTGPDTIPSWTSDGFQYMESYGAAISGAGDVNGDGYSDIVIGAIFFDIDDYSYGRVELFHGGPAGLEPEPVWEKWGEKSNSYTGGTLAGLGDINDDGFDDVIIGAYLYGNQENNEGRAYVYQGTPYIIRPDTLEYGEVIIGEYFDLSLTIINTDDTVLNGNLSLSPSYFTIQSGGTYNISPGDSHSVTIRYEPGSTGMHVDSLISDDSPFQDVILIGKGIECYVSPSNLDFGTITLGDSKNSDFAIYNVNDEVLTGNISESCTEFSIVSGEGPYSLNPGDTLPVTIKFEPTYCGTYECYIETGAALCADVYCVGTSEGTSSNCTASASFIMPPSVDIGSYVDTTVTVINTGLGILCGTVYEEYDHFSLVAGGGPYILNPFDTFEITIRFQPTAEGSHICQVFTDLPCASTILVIGTGVMPPDCFIEPASIDFGSVLPGDWSDTTLTIKNIGITELTGDLSESCEEFSIQSGNGAFNLIPGDSLEVTLRYEPLSGGIHTCSIETGTAMCTDIYCEGEAPDCLVEPDTLEFGGVFIGGFSDTTFIITNTGEGILDGSVSETFDHFDIISGSGLYSLAGGDTHHVTIRYEPTVVGIHTCTIYAGSAICGDLYCSGNVTDCLVEPSSIDFGSVDQGGSADTTFIIINNGAGSLAGDVGISCPDFSIITGDGPFDLPAGDTLTVTVHYEPAGAGTHLCTIETGSGICADVECQGGSPSCVVEPDTLDFGTVEAGLTSDLVFIIRNNGGGLLEGEISESCPEYDLLSGSGTYSLAAGDSLIVTVQFTPSIPGEYNCSIATGSVLCSDVTLLGGSPGCLVEPDTLDFGSVETGSFLDKTFTLKNTGGGILSGDITESCSEFNVTNGFGPFGIPGGDSLEVTVRYEPLSGGEHSCFVTTGTSGCDSIYCIGGSPECAVVPDTLDFGTVSVGGYVEMSFTVSNDGGGILDGDISLSCSEYSIVMGGGPFSLLAGDSIVAIISYEPADESAHQCSFETGTLQCGDVFLTGSGGAGPLILSISDVGYDQGRNVRINFARSPRDAAGSPEPIYHYKLFLRDGPLWTQAGYVPAHGDNEYNMIASTLADSTDLGINWSVFYVRAYASDTLVSFDSPPDSGYSIDNIIPTAPIGFAVQYNTGEGTHLSWDPSTDGDFRATKVYMGLTENFFITEDNLVFETTGTEWLDESSETGFYYKVAHVDMSGNRSEPASPGTVTDGSLPPAPQSFELYQNVPNPFNPATHISYDIPRDGCRVTLKIYDVSGRLIRTLVDGTETAGQKTVVWDGTGDSGGRVTTGVYFYQLKAGEFERTRKMVMLR